MLTAEAPCSLLSFSMCLPLLLLGQQEDSITTSAVRRPFTLSLVHVHKQRPTREVCPAAHQEVSCAC
jgi:hypothetical protein